MASSHNDKRVILDGAEAKLFNLVRANASPRQWEELLLVPLEYAATAGDAELVTKLLQARENNTPLAG